MSSNDRFGHDFITATGERVSPESLRWTLVSADVQGAELSHDGVIRTEIGGITFETKAGGTCDRCGMAIVVIVALKCEHGIAHVGTDCAETLLGPTMPNSIKRVRKAASDHTKAVTAARKARKTAALVSASADILARCEAVISTAMLGSFADSIAKSIRYGIQHGKAPSAKQLACLARVECEVQAA